MNLQVFQISKGRTGSEALVEETIEDEARLKQDFEVICVASLIQIVGEILP